MGHFKQNLLNFGLIFLTRKKEFECIHLPNTWVKLLLLFKKLSKFFRDKRVPRVVHPPPPLDYVLTLCTYLYIATYDLQTILFYYAEVKQIHQVGIGRQETLPGSVS